MTPDLFIVILEHILFYVTKQIYQIYVYCFSRTIIAVILKKFQWNILDVFNRARQIFGQRVGVERVKFIKLYLFFRNPVIHTDTRAPLPPRTRNPSSSVIRLREKLLLLSSPRPRPHIFKPFFSLLPVCPPCIISYLSVRVLFVIIFTVLLVCVMISVVKFHIKRGICYFYVRSVIIYRFVLVVAHAKSHMCHVRGRSLSLIDRIMFVVSVAVYTQPNHFAVRNLQPGCKLTKIT